MGKFIVAEISKSWERGSMAAELLCHQFERVINTNLERGYKLADWKLHSAMRYGVFTETIIAIFEKINND